MSAEVESMFYVREKPWHGLGIKVQEAPNSGEALKLAKLDWTVIQESVYTEDRQEIAGYKANVRDLDHKILGIVSDRYKKERSFKSVLSCSGFNRYWENAYRFIMLTVRQVRLGSLQ